MSLFNAMKAVRELGNLADSRDVIINNPLTTTIEGPANNVSEIPQPHGIPMSVKLYPDGDVYQSGDEVVKVEVKDPNIRRKSMWNKLGTPDGRSKSKVFENSARNDPMLSPTEASNSWKNTEVNLNHMGQGTGNDDCRIKILKDAYADPCRLSNHQICSVNLRKGLLYHSKSLVKMIIRSHNIAHVDNPRGIPRKWIKSSIVNMMDVFRVTPLMVAANIGNYKLIVLLLEHGADPTYKTHAGETALSIAAKHHDEKLIEVLVDYGADIGTALMIAGLNRSTLRREKHIFGSHQRNQTMAGCSNYGFNFEPILIISQPKFLLRMRNPVLEAFKVGTILKKIGRKKDEYLGDCEELERQTDDFAYYYLDQCRSMWEALLLLRDPNSDGTGDDPTQRSGQIDLLQYALKKKKMKFISHHYCQQYFMDLWYGGVQHGRVRNTLKKLGQLFIIHLLMPFFFFHQLLNLIINFDLKSYMGYNYTRPMTVWRYLHVPVLSYIVDFINFFVLLMSLIQACLFAQNDSHIWESPGEALLWMCLGARFMVEMDKLRMQGKNFFRHAGNIIDLSVSSSIIVTVLIRFIADAGFTDTTTVGLSTSYIYATAFLGLMLRMLEMLDITYTLGPLEGAISKMMMDVLKVCVLLVICMIGFSVSMWTITKQSYYAVNKRSNFTTSIDLPPLFNSLNQTLITLLWSTFGLIEPDNIEITYDSSASNYLQFLWAVYILTAMVLFLNMLIAMLTETYVNTINNAEIEWKFARSVVVEKYQGTHPFIFPVNLVLYPLFLIAHFLKTKIDKDIDHDQNCDADIQTWKQSAFLHMTIKKRFKARFEDVLNIPYYYKCNIFNFYMTYPFSKKVKKRIRTKVRDKTEKENSGSESNKNSSNSD